MNIHGSPGDSQLVEIHHCTREHGEQKSILNNTDAYMNGKEYFFVISSFDNIYNAFNNHHDWT